MKKYMMLTVLVFLIVSFDMLPSVSANGYGWGYKKNSDHKLPDIGEYQDMLKKYGAYYADNTGEKTIYLTFDNGYEQGYTDNILNVLKKQQVPATFFVTGHYVESEPDLVKRMVDEGHIVGNHSYHHPDFSIMDKEAIKEELETLEDAVAEVSDQKEIKYLRPPRGMFNENTLKWSKELGYIHIFWSLAFKDWETKKQKGWKYAFEQTMDQVHPGAIILLHTVSSDNAEALDRIITELKKQGYRFKSLDDLVLKDQLPKAIYGL
ncbi:MAG: delta-lactam-biosynthetic de-N-acetylase [Bacillota bacterium]|uniref:Delta-lactam-biosynthetic de-N-acetylase n=1 Tax=Virgibacillus salarius TaxID=447199 RepID=A0A941IAD5_9BACI|nr:MULTISPECIES: delta-lactam-biosynthetic de-N-acetylase [Bacillaceae]MBR7795241.1 delta-lactam-biosynthetic de-N-acetylase [Virgibacillus salarius]MCC2251510.1 delta-lactam-biosynthetic de-N-acetylase [Virgibacillus sp. AGTR]NAZ07957.1 delta-lactam-biosynthetic de-N-acetylase [Agaribacter marinus]QRZ19955.1 delta-lactam-biosynthetic de-N-acetylase [Virgibacillus sp. AGTR]